MNEGVQLLNQESEVSVSNSSRAEFEQATNNIEGFAH